MDPITFYMLVSLVTLCMPIRWSICICGLLTATCLFTLATVTDVDWGTGLVRGFAVMTALASLAALTVRVLIWSAVFVYRNTPR